LELAQTIAHGQPQFVANRNWYGHAQGRIGSLEELRVASQPKHQTARASGFARQKQHLVRNDNQQKGGQGEGGADFE